MCVCVSLWIEKAVEVRYIYDKRGRRAFLNRNNQGVSFKLEVAEVTDFIFIMQSLDLY